MKIGVFDHMDSNFRSVSELYNTRLNLVEQYDRAGFYAYHLAEHHATPLGLAPSPAVFLAAVAQRTKRLRIGPLVYILSLQNPLRAYEDICMLDQISGGRVELGLGRGISPIEIGYYGVDPNEAPGIYQEAAAIVLTAFTTDSLTFHGKYFHFQDCPLEITCVQKPHPPLWVGVGNREAVVRAAKSGINMVCSDTPARVRLLTDCYREEWNTLGKQPNDLPIMGMNLHVVVADTEGEATKIAKPAYERWRASLHYLWDKQGVPLPGQGRRLNFEEAIHAKSCIVGTPQTVHDILYEQIEQAGINYLLCRFAFGDLAYECSARSVELFASQVMPHLSPAG